MRTYPRNSPQAAARIVALLLTSDGHVCSSEERALDKLDIAGQLGLAPEQFAQIVQTLCEDHSIAHAPFAPMAGQIDTPLLATLLVEIDDPALRRKVMRLCMAVAIADGHLADGEIALLAAVFSVWGPAPALAAVRHGTPPGILRGHERAASTT
ncbi:Tellurite resistance protein TerB [Paraburkholderia phenazinium]|uniref:Tellurite resistance protein TerB n=1 Tax=Paraburkholderia phenazinium TaxID=60549 RepID=A0A1G7NW97_9BURK|nr:TerB family tellurite resistance protein [Paraburkholderia phenazinium]SDF78274.1 Tellurite resistance protein TerB [Paraburkholderia phenazinium]